MKAKKRARPKAKTRPRGRAAAPNSNFWSLRLYVAGQTPRSLTALVNLRRLCESHLPGRHIIEVIDLLRSPELGQRDEIVALPTLVRKLPAPVKRLIGDLSNTERVLVGMELSPSRTLP